MDFLAWTTVIIILIIVTVADTGTYAYLVDVEVPWVQSGAEDSYFGFSVSFHGYSKQALLLVGAPKASASKPVPDVDRPGVLFNCPVTAGLSEPCLEVPVDRAGNDRASDGRASEEKSAMWLGSAVMSAGMDQQVMVCARAYKQIWRWPGYANVSGDTDVHDDVGRCYLLPGNLQGEESVQTIQACNYFSHSKGPGPYWLSQCGVGDRIDVMKTKTMAAAVDAGNVTGADVDFYRFAIGGPSQLIGRGQTFLVEYSTEEANATTRTTGFPHTKNYVDTYMGYALAQGDVDGDGVAELASSRPGDYEGGCVWLIDGSATYAEFFSSHFNRANLLIEIRSREEVGEYFGYSMAMADVDGDGRSDLLVGAPLYSAVAFHDEHRQQYDAGRVYVFSAQQLAVLIEEHRSTGKVTVLSSSTADSAKIVGQGRSWFGSSIMSMGDMDRDGFEDVAIGAPFEETSAGKRGAVYLHFGSAEGLQLDAKQKLTAESITGGRPMNGFGFSISRRWDIDGNGFNDLAVGAPFSSSAIVFRSRPAIVVTMSVLIPRHPANEHKYCTVNQHTNVLCTVVSICASYTSVGDDIESEVKYITKVNGSLLFTDTTSRTLTPSAGGTLKLTSQFPVRKCFDHTLILPDSRKPCLNTSVFVSEWHLVHRPSTETDLSPVLQQRSHRLPPPAVVEFVGSCAGCQPDLKLDSLFLEPGTEQTPIILGREKHLFLKFRITNQMGQQSTASSACGAHFQLSLPAGLTFKNVVKGHIRACGADVNAGSAKCHIRPLIPPGTAELFSIQLNVDRSLASSLERFLTIDIVVRSENKDRDLSDNLQRLRKKVSREASLSLSGMSYQRQVDISKSAESNPALSAKLGPLVGHEYVIYNEGPSPIPQSKIQLNWPQMVDAGSALLHLVDIQSNMKSLICNHTALVSRPEDVSGDAENGTQKLRASLTDSTAGPSDPEKCVSLGDLCHVSVHCSVPPMARKTAANILVSWRVNTHLTRLERQKLPLTINTTVQLLHVASAEGFQHIHTDKHSAYAVTTIYEVYVKPAGQVKWWIILIAVLIGFLLVMICMYIMYKCGFFERKKLDRNAEQKVARASIR